MADQFKVTNAFWAINGRSAPVNRYLNSSLIWSIPTAMCMEQTAWCCRCLWRAIFALSWLVVTAYVPAQTNSLPGLSLSSTQAVSLARLALSAIDREFPHKPGVVFNSAAEVKRPGELHPAFFGSFDWHSSVHGHWLLVRLLRLQPDLPLALEIRARLETHFNPTNLAAEAALFDVKGNRSFERMYGWAWALRLAAELRAFDDPAARRWSANFAPLEQKLVGATLAYLPKLTYPVRTGVHPDTGFALAQILDYARAAGNTNLAQLIAQRAQAFYGQDRDYPVTYEPSGEDFFSSGLNEADLMRRVLAPDAFSRWLDAFWPALRRGELAGWGTPALVSDLSDPKIVHLVGLNLSRAWTLRGIASALPAADPRRSKLEQAAAAHGAEGLKYVLSGHYEGEHWLGTFAVYYLTDSGLAGLNPNASSSTPR